jgi:flagellar assembly factor FliW
VHDEALPFLWLRAADRAGLSLVLIEPREIEPEYAVSFSRAELARIGLAPGDPCLMLAVVTLGQDGATVNLRAPLVLNPERMCGAQIILDDATWPLRRPLDADGSR